MERRHKDYFEIATPIIVTFLLLPAYQLLFFIPADYHNRFIKVKKYDQGMLNKDGQQQSISTK